MDRKNEKLCRTCKRIFKRANKQYGKSWKEQKYCSIECFYKVAKGMPKPKGFGAKISRAVRKRGRGTPMHVVAALKVSAFRIGCSVEDVVRERTKGNHWCMYCRQWISRDKFSKDSTRKSGRAHACKRCMTLRILAVRYKMKWENILMLLAGTCHICGIGDTPLEIDHDHKTGRVRGALCRKCNMVLGMFRDDVKRFRAAIKYLSSNRSHHKPVSKAQLAQLKITQFRRKIRASSS